MSRFILPATPPPERKRLRFPREARLREGREFSQVRENGRVSQGRLLRVALLCLESGAPAKAGIITSKRVGGAVVRNKVRRRLRELIRASRPDFPAGALVVAIAKPASASASFEELKGEWLLLARRLSILPPPA
ncbi:MAG: ribonuclease P protein component [Verrucomicrobia bacterium]|nr:ribonuclease P protein component [Verrucomicrobiota bacterium]